MANNMCSMCGGGAGGSRSPNFSKQIVGSPPSYGTILGDGPSESYGGYGGRRGQNMQMIQVCLPSLAGPPAHQPGTYSAGQQPSVINVPRDPASACPKFVCEPCPPPPPTKVWLIKSSPIPQKSACLPMGGSDQGCPSQSAKLMICLPCPPPGQSPPVPQVQPSTDRRKVLTFPFAVPQKVDTDLGCGKSGGKNMPPPERKVCSTNCIHVSDIKAEKSCSWHRNVPCVAHCFNTPL